MTKKLSLFALVALLSVGFVGCGDDDDSDSKKANGEACAKADECTSDYCDADSKKCAEKPVSTGSIDEKIEGFCSSELMKDSKEDCLSDLKAEVKDAKDKWADCSSKVDDRINCLYENKDKGSSDDIRTA